MLYPLRFKEILRHYPCGNRWITETYYRKRNLAAELTDDQSIAETWEVCDRPGESSTVINGPLAGETLHTLIADYGADLLGRDIVAQYGTRFPLLIKFRDASNGLAAQTAPRDTFAAATYPRASFAPPRDLKDSGNTAAWYMLRTQRHATVHCGQRDDAVTMQTLHAALLTGNIRDEMREYPVIPGDAFMLYPGTMHSSTGGILFYEVMQNSAAYIDLHPPEAALSAAEKETQIAAMLAGIHLENSFNVKTRAVSLQRGRNTQTFIFACHHLALERLDLQDSYWLDCNGERFFVLSQIRGWSTIIWGDTRETLWAGQTCLLPANLGTVKIMPENRKCTLLNAYVPNLGRDIAKTLQHFGFMVEATMGLGGYTKLNPLRKICHYRPTWR